MKQSKMGIVAFILSLTILAFPVAFVLSIIDLSKNRQNRHGLSIAALAISGFWLLLFSIAIVVPTDETIEKNEVVSSSEETVEESVDETNTNTEKNDTDDVEYTIIEYKIGDTQVFDELEITINDVCFSEYLGNLEGLHKADDGYVYCNVYISVKNIGTSSKELKSVMGNCNYGTTLIYNTDYKYNSVFSEYADFFDMHDSIPALGTLSNKVISYLVPTEVMENDDLPLTMLFKENSVWKDDNVVWNLR